MLQTMAVEVHRQEIRTAELLLERSLGHNQSKMLTHLLQTLKATLKNLNSVKHMSHQSTRDLHTISSHISSGKKKSFIFREETVVATSE